MSDCKLYGLFIWMEDEPVTGTVLKLSNITTPFYYSNELQQRDFNQYKVGQEVEAKCPGFGLNKAVIGKIEDESNKKDLEDILRGDDFNLMVSRLSSNQQKGTNEPQQDKNANTAQVEQKEKDTSSTKKKKEKKQSENTATKELPQQEQEDQRTPTQQGKRRAADMQATSAKKKKEKKQSKITAPKELSQKELEAIGEDLNLLELVPLVEPEIASASKSSSCTSSLLRESLQMVLGESSGGDQPENASAEMSYMMTLPTDQQQCSSCRDIYAKLNSLESHVQWLTSNIRQLYQSVQQVLQFVPQQGQTSNQVHPQQPAQAACPSPAFPIPSCSAQSEPAPSPAQLDASSPPTQPTIQPPAQPTVSSAQPVLPPQSPSQSMVPTPAGSDCQIFQGFTKAQLRKKS